MNFRQQNSDLQTSVINSLTVQANSFYFQRSLSNSLTLPGFQGHAVAILQIHTGKDLCPLCKLESKDNYHFLFKCKIMKPEWDKFWSKLFNTIHTWCEHEASIANGFINNLSHSSKVLLLTGSLILPFQKFTNDVIRRFVAFSVHKVIKIRKRLVEKGKIKLGGSSACFSALARWSLDANL